MRDLKAEIERYEQELAAARERGDRLAELGLLSHLGEAHSDQADEFHNLTHHMDSTNECYIAINYHQQALVLARTLGDRTLEIDQLVNIGLVSRSAKHGDESYYSQALEIAREISDLKRQQKILGLIGFVFRSQDNIHDALVHQLEALKLAREIAEPELLLANLNEIAGIYSEITDSTQFVRYAEEALNISRTLDNPEKLSNQLSMLAAAYQKAGDGVKTVQYYEEAVAIERKRGSQPYWRLSDYLGNLAYLYLGPLRDVDRAMACFEETLQLYRQNDDQESLNRRIGLIAIVLSNSDENVRAIQYADQYLAICQSSSLFSTRVEGLTRAAYVYLRAGHHQQALDYQNQALEIVRQYSDLRMEQTLLYGLSGMYRQIRNESEYQKYWMQGLLIAPKIRDTFGIKNLAELYEQNGELAKAMGYYQLLVKLFMTHHEIQSITATEDKIAEIHRKLVDVGQGGEA